MRTRVLLLISSLFFVVSGQSQEYLEMIDAGSYSVQEIIDNAEAYFEGKDKGRGSGYKQFKRWEYTAKRLMKENGYLPSMTENMVELERYNAYLNETANNRGVLNDDWQELGPTDWNATTSWNPGVGRITSIAVDKTNNDHIIVGANTGGVWRTTDAGQNWQPLNDNFTNLTTYAVAIDPSDSDTYYFGSSSGLIFKSIDAGATWNQLADISTSLVNKILINPDNTDIMFACSQNVGIFRSDDGGATWIEVAGDTRAYDVEFKPGDTSVVYASGTGFHKSIDSGVSFTTITGVGNSAKMIGVSADDDTRVYIVEANGGSFGAFYVSTDSGDNFTELDHSGRNYFGYDTAGLDPGGQAPRDMDITVNPNDVDEVHIAGILTWRSLDGGVSFTCTADWVPGAAAGANIGYCHADVDILEFEGTTLYAGTDGGIFKAEDTGNLTASYYTDITQGIGIRQFYKIGVSQTANVVVTGGSQDNGTSFYTAAGGWKDWLGADGMEGFVDKDDSNVMYGMIQNGRMYRTDDAANTIVNLGEPGAGSGNWVTPFEQDPSATNTLYLGYDRVYKSVNKGIGWSAISQNFGGNLEELKVAPSNNQIMYAANSNLIYKTEDGGATNWVQTAVPGGVINSLAIHPTDPNRVAVATGSANRVYVSVDGGASWVNYRKNLPNFASGAVVWQDNGANGLYVGMSYGIYYIDDTKTEWEPYSNNLPNVIINELEINSIDGKIYAATYGRGLWASPIADEVVLNTDKFLSADGVNVVPNPTSDALKVILDRAVEADLRVFDVSGKLVIYQPDIEIHSVHTIDVSALNSGVYFLRVNSNAGTITKKFIKN